MIRLPGTTLPLLFPAALLAVTLALPAAGHDLVLRGGRVMDPETGLDAGRTQVNYGTASSHELARSLVLDGIEAKDVSEAARSRGQGTRWADGVPSADELAAIMETIDTGLAAMRERGRLQAGMVADIVVFDPASVTDNATYAESALPTTGIDYVLVGGRVTVDGGRVRAAVFEGEAIRFPPRPAD